MVSKSKFWQLEFLCSFKSVVYPGSRGFESALERISTEMVFHGLYHFSRAVLRDEANDVVTYLARAL